MATAVLVRDELIVCCLQDLDNLFKYGSQALLLHLHVETVILNASE